MNKIIQGQRQICWTKVIKTINIHFIVSPHEPCIRICQPLKPLPSKTHYHNINKEIQQKSLPLLIRTICKGKYKAFPLSTTLPSATPLLPCAKNNLKETNTSIIFENEKWVLGILFASCAPQLWISSTKEAKIIN